VTAYQLNRRHGTIGGEPMGQFRLTVTLFPRQGGEPRPLQALVDTGACYSVVPAPILAELGCRPLRMQGVVLGDGRTDEWPLTQVDLECEARRMTTTVLMGPVEGHVVLGAVTLEELGFGVDPVRKRLIPVVAYV
jgi:aspartyl protease family protein